MHRLDHDLDTCRLLEAGEGREIRSRSLVIRVKVESAETGAAFALAEYVMPVGGSEATAPHRHHAASETLYVLEGTLAMRAGPRTVTAGPGACLHVPPGAVHAFANPGPEPVRFLQIVSPGSLLTMIEDVSAPAADIATVFRRYDTEVVG